ncbi:MAG: N-acetylneuraminate synthase family protein, partial [Alphaproteobacteria bacterium]
DFEPVIRAAAGTGLPVILSTGVSTAEEVDAAIGWFRDTAATPDIRDRLILMHCVSAYPAPIEEANTLSIPYLAERTGLRVGYSNHIVGPEACLAAVALGACIIEVHFTDCKTGREFRDHALSCDPDDLAGLVEMVPRIRASLGQPGKERQPSELPNLSAVRKGVVAARDLEAGRVLARDDLMFARPADEVPAAEIDSLQGARLKAAVGKGELIRRNNLERD